MKKEDISFLAQIVESLEDSQKKLEEAHQKQDAIEFNKIKKFMMEMQDQISGLLK